jgi:hypothetical protein
MAMPEMEAVKDAALKYDKKTLGRLAQLGQISATLAVMAGMMRDRIVQSEMKPSTKTVSQDVLPADSMGIEGFSDPTAVQQPVMRRAGGLTNIPVRDNMYEMAGGGIVAFQAGGATPSFTSALAGEIPADPRYLRAYQAARGEKMPRKGLTELMTLSELQEFNRTGAIPERLSAQVQGRMIEDIPAFGAGTYEPEVSTPFVGKTPEQIDPFSGTQTLGGAALQTDPGEVSGDQTPSTAMLKQAAAQQAATQQAAAQQAAAQQAAAQQAAAQQEKPSLAQEVPEKRTMEQLIAERTGLYGEDPRKAAMKAALENASKESESDRILDALRLISAGDEKYTKGTSKEFESLLTDRAKKKAAAEQRAYKAADIEGMDYDTRRKAIDSILGERREEAKTKEERKFREDLLTKELTARADLNKEDIKARKEVARIAADSKPEQFLVKALEIFQTGTEAQKAAVREVFMLQGKGDLLSRLGGAGGPDIKSVMKQYNIEPTR